jgi:hypothetical protein
MAEGSRKSYTPPAIRDCGRITERTLQSIHCSQEATDSEQPALERTPHSSILREPGEPRPARGAP